MSAYRVRGPWFSGGVAFRVAQLWNPSSTRIITVTEVGLFFADTTGTAGQKFYLARGTSRGTISTSVTPDANNALEGDSAPPSGVILDYDITGDGVSTDILGTPLIPFFGGGTQGTGFIWPIPRGIKVYPGTSLAILMSVIETFGGGGEVYYEFED